jgi:hypothetical protein
MHVTLARHKRRGRLQLKAKATNESLLGHVERLMRDGYNHGHAPFGQLLESFRAWNTMVPDDLDGWRNGCCRQVRMTNPRYNLGVSLALRFSDLLGTYYFARTVWERADSSPCFEIFRVSPN